MGHIHSVYDTDAHFVIDPITRAINSKAHKKITLIQGDHNSERFSFEVPRYIEGHDMSLCNKVEVHFLNIDSTTKEQHSDMYTVADLQISPDDKGVVLCSWLISKSATQLVGPLRFLLKYKCIEGTVLTYAWHTAICDAITISNGIDAGETFAEEHVDIIAQWRAQVTSDITAEVNANVSEWAETESGKLRGMMFTEMARTNADLAVERSRIDLMQSSATADDAELVDARVGADGVTYESAGTAIREQIKRLPEKFISGVRNMFDMDAVTHGHYVNPANGELLENDGFCASNFIPVIPGETYTVKFISNAAFYNASMNYLKAAGSAATFIAPDDAFYFRCSINADAVDTFSMNVGNTLLPYLDYGKTFLTLDSFPEKLLVEMRTKTDNLVKTYDVTYFDKIITHLTNPFIKTQIKLVGDSITAGMGGTGFSETGEQIPGSIRANNLEAVCWSNMLHHYINRTFNHDVEVPMDNANVMYNVDFAIDTFDTVVDGIGVYGKRAILLNNKIQQNAVEFSFYGDHFSVYYEKGTDRGIFEIYVDGELKTTVDCYADTASKRNRVDTVGLSNERHTVHLAMTNDRNTTSTLNQIRLNGIVVPKTAIVKPWGVGGTTSNSAKGSNQYSEDDDFVIMRYGTNDRHTLFTAEQTYQNLVDGMRMITDNYGAEVILMCSCPASEKYESSESVIRYFHMWDVKNAVAKAANHFHMPYIDNYDAFMRYAEDHNTAIDDLLADGLHPNDLGYKVMFENIIRTLGLPLLPEFVRN